MRNEELLTGRRAIAAVVVDKEGSGIAAVELTVPTQVYSSCEELAQLDPCVVATARRIAATLEGQGIVGRTGKGMGG